MIHLCTTTPDNEQTKHRGINTQGLTSLTRKQDTPGETNQGGTIKQPNYKLTTKHTGNRK